MAKKIRGPSAKSKAAFFIGVGMSAARDPDVRKKLTESSPYKSSVIAGYNADNKRDVSRDFTKHRASKNR